MKTCNSAWARASKRPFLMPCQPISCTVLTSWPGSSRPSRQSRHSSRSSFTSAQGEQLFGGSLDEGDHLLPTHSGKAGEEFVNRLATFEVIYEVLDRNARASENRRAAKDIRVGAKHIRQ